MNAQISLILSTIMLKSKPELQTRSKFLIQTLINIHGEAKKIDLTTKNPTHLSL